ncbi:MAG: hypothetical protein ACTHJT_16570 [Cytophaga sp.]
MNRLKATPKKGKQKPEVKKEKVQVNPMLVSDMGIGFKMLDFKSNN